MKTQRKRRTSNSIVTKKDRREKKTKSLSHPQCGLHYRDLKK